MLVEKGCNMMMVDTQIRLKTQWSPALGFGLADPALEYEARDVSVRGEEDDDGEISGDDSERQCDEERNDEEAGYGNLPIPAAE